MQPLDISINKVYKQSLRNTYVGYWIGKNNIKVSKRTIFKWVDEFWYSDSVITNKMMLNSFKYSGINNLLDVSEDDKFRGYEDIDWDYLN